MKTLGSTIQADKVITINKGENNVLIKEKLRGICTDGFVSNVVNLTLGKAEENKATYFEHAWILAERHKETLVEKINYILMLNHQHLGKFDPNKRPINPLNFNIIETIEDIIIAVEYAKEN